ncbi:4-hydroxybenzoate 3-monooxygenase [Pelagibius litoralis]|uniref:4-hydroxybenzoate 3-monooxygenase n=1 Tax=Pelagibius litoralis TaxID=374515 RepID=A0A967F1U0_9PROT|nr:4-hydroxybenzoate 3-monooxygenase [Pelagibius litoralis]NIA71376.1 4-hydroxybenzoate 3-monooxygenase [Pelagibius litoralis]
MRTQVVIVGGGPSGLLLSLLLDKHGIDSVILERKTKDHVLSRIRAGVLERGLVGLLREVGCASRLEREGYVHDGTILSFEDERIGITFTDHVDETVVVYGQTEVTRDLYEAREAAGGKIEFNVEDVMLDDVRTDSPFVTYCVAEEGRRIDCDFIAGCDGFHGVSRKSIPAEVRQEFEKVYPFGWLGILSKTPPVEDKLIYASSKRGFALCSMRNENLSRYYIQCDLDDRIEDWSDDAFWDELRRRIPKDAADKLVTGPSIEKSIAPLRSFVCEPMQWGKLFLCGDAAHIVPPTGAKGLNTAASDVHYLYNALVQFYLDGDRTGIDGYSEKALGRVWKAERFSWWMTSLLHRFPHQGPFDLKMQQAEISFLKSNREAQSVLAQNYVGLPY